MINVYVIILIHIPFYNNHITTISAILFPISHCVPLPHGLIMQLHQARPDWSVNRLTISGGYESGWMNRMNNLYQKTKKKLQAPKKNGWNLKILALGSLKIPFPCGPFFKFQPFLLP